MLTFAPKPLL